MKKFNLLLALISVCFSAFSQAPTITSFSPASGPVGTLVTITGTGLTSPTAFTIGGVAAIIVSDNGTTLVGMVMPGAITGAVSVTTAGGAASASNFTVTPTGYPRYQQGPKLVGTAYVGPNVLQGDGVAISADGNTAIAGGPDDSTDRGAAWVYTRSGPAWAQQGPKLIGTGAVGTYSAVGNSVALSADGKTAILGGPGDSLARGAAWIFVRSGTTWAQQSKLVGTGAVRNSNQGISVAISADGNTAVVGGWQDSSTFGAAWVYTRTGTTWVQQGQKLVGSGAGAIGYPNQGRSVALSADGKTILVGGYNDNNGLGATWVFTDSAGIWVQQGPKLVGTGSIDSPYNTQQGTSVALSADGNTAIVGGAGDSSLNGAVWIFTRSGPTWSQQGPKLVGSGVAPNTPFGARQGSSVALSADGNTAIAGGWNDSSSYGAIWVFIRSGGIWHQQGPKLLGTGGITASVWRGFAASLSADGNTTVVGGPEDNSNTGAAWIFVNDTVSSCLSNASSFSHGMCQGDTFTFDNMQIGSSGTYTDTLTNLSGCDSLVTLSLTVNPLPVVSFVQNDTIVCTDCGWYSGGAVGGAIALNGGTPAGGVYNGSYVAGDSIIVPVVIWDSLETVTYTYTDSNGCSSSASHLFWINAVEGLTQINSNEYHLYPNPNKGSFSLQTSNSVGSDYTISDMLGHIIMQQTIRSDNETIELPDAADGVYALAVKGSQPVRFVVVR